MAVRRIEEVTAEMENFRVENKGGINVIRRDPVEPLPIGSLVAMVFRVAGYDNDCDGSLMARLEAVDESGETTGWTVKCIGLYPDSAWQVDRPDEIAKKARGE